MNCTKYFNLTGSKSASSVDGKKYVYEYKIDKLIVNNTGTYGCRIELEKNWFNLTEERINVYRINITSKQEPVQVHGTENTLSCTADHPKVSDDTVLKITWYKGTDAVKDGDEFKSEQEVLSTLKLEGNWEDSAPFRCLFEYSNPYITPAFSAPIDIAYVGIYRSSTYRYFNQDEADKEDKLILTKIDNKDLPLVCYLQTKKKDTITGATWKIAGITKDGKTVENKVTEGEKEVPIASFGTVTWEADNSPFETASRWRITAPLVTKETSAVGTDITAQCQYAFEDKSKTTQTASMVVRTYAHSNTAAVYVETWPVDFMTSYSDVASFLTKSAVVWNTQIAGGTNHYNVDIKYNEAGLLSTSPATKYASWTKTYANLFFGSPSVVAAGGKTTMKLSTDYDTNAKYKDISTYYSCSVASSTVLVGDKYFASPAYVAYMPTIQTNNGTKVYATVGSTITLTCSMHTGIVQVTWFKGDVEQTGWHSYYKKEDKKVYTKFVIENIKLESQGTYACAAGLVTQKDNKWPVKHEITLFVVEAKLANAYAPVGKAVTLTCSMPTSQKPDEVLWYGNGKLLTSSNTIEFDTLNNKVLALHTIAVVASKDFGTYKAVAYFNRSVSSFSSPQ